MIMWYILKTFSVCLEAAAFRQMVKKKQHAFFPLMLGSHFLEYLFIGKKLADEKNIRQENALLNCLLFGFAWWYPLRSSKQRT